MIKVTSLLIVAESLASYQGHDECPGYEANLGSVLESEIRQK